MLAKFLKELISARIHVAPVFAPMRIQENTPGELFMHWFRARGYQGEPRKHQGFLTSRILDPLKNKQKTRKNAKEKKGLENFKPPYLRRLGRFSLATIAFAVFPLFPPLAITAFGGLEGYFSIAII